jgi:hypothetical protein
MCSDNAVVTGEPVRASSIKARPGRSRHGGLAMALGVADRHEELEYCVRGVRRMMDKSIAYSNITIKSFDDRRALKGIASTATPDRMGCGMVAGAEFRPPRHFCTVRCDRRPADHAARVVGNHIVPMWAPGVTDAPPTLKERLTWRANSNPDWCADCRSDSNRKSTRTSRKRAAILRQMGMAGVVDGDHSRQPEATITTIKSIASSQRAALGRNAAGSGS